MSNPHSPARFRTPARIGRPRLEPRGLAQALRADLDADRAHPWKWGTTYRPEPGYCKPYLGEGYWLVWREEGVLLAAFYGKCWDRHVGRYVKAHWLDAFTPTTLAEGDAVFIYAGQAWRLMRNDEPGYPPQLAGRDELTSPTESVD